MNKKMEISGVSGFARLALLCAAVMWGVYAALIGMLLLRESPASVASLIIPCLLSCALVVGLVYIDRRATLYVFDGERIVKKGPFWKHACIAKMSEIRRAGRFYGGVFLQHAATGRKSPRSAFLWLNYRDSELAISYIEACRDKGAEYLEQTSGARCDE